MANSLTPIMMKILANAALHLRRTCIMPTLVNNDLQASAARKGATIDVEIPVAAMTSPVVPGPVPPAPTDSTTKTVPVTLDNWEKTDFFLTDKDVEEIESKDFFLPMKAQSAIIALANKVNDTILAEYTRIYGYVGVAGTTPFGSGSVAGLEAIAARRVLTEQFAPKENRALVVDLVSEANALSLPVFMDAEKRGDGGKAKRDGEMGRAYGFDWYAEQSIPTHVTGTLSNGTGHAAVVNGAVAAGAAAVSIDATSLTGTVVTGDIFTVAGDTQTYTVTSGPHTAASNAIAGIQFDPPSKLGFADNAVITFKASHVVNLAFQRGAFAFANRVFSDIPFEGGQLFKVMTDPVSGLTFRLTVDRQHMQTAWTFDMLWGTRIVQPELAVRVAG